MEFRYVPQGVCSREFIFDIEDDIIKDMKIVGGCAGNTAGVCKLAVGRKVDEIIELLEGIPCGMKGTSCPDQVAKALKKYKNSK